MNKNYRYFMSLIKISKAPLYMYIVLVISMLYLALFNVMLSFLIQLGLDEVIYKTGEVNISYVVVALISVCLLYIVIYYLNEVFKEYICQYISKKLKVKILKNVIDLPLIESQKIEKGDYLTRIIEDCDNCSSYLIKTVLPAIQFFLNIIFGLIYAISFSWQFTLLIFVTLPFMFIINKKYGEKVTTAFQKVQEKEGKRRSLFEEIYSNGSIIKIFNIHKNLLNKNKELFDDKYKYFKDEATSIGDMISITETGMLIIELFLLVCGVFLVTNNSLLIGAFIGVWNAAIGSIVYPVTELPSIISELAEQYASWERLSELFLENFKEEDNSTKKELINPILKAKNLSFSYLENNKVLKDIDFQCCIGERVFIIGESGCGKSTFIKLLLNLYRGKDGEVYIEDKECKISGKDLSYYISYVPQGNTLFKMTVYDNIAFGMEGISKEEVVKAARQANIDEFIKRLPKGYDTILSEDTDISEGQAQRIAIARAFVRNKPYIIMDEPFSALDKNNTNDIIKTIESISKDKGCIIISHDEASISCASRIVHLKGGEVIERE